MNVRDLIKELMQYPEDALVVMASDGEGNSHSPLSGVDGVFYVPDNTWSGTVYDKNDAEVNELEFQDAVVFFPTN